MQPPKLKNVRLVRFGQAEIGDAPAAKQEDEAAAEPAARARQAPILRPAPPPPPRPDEPFFQPGEPDPSLPQLPAPERKAGRGGTLLTGFLGGVAGALLGGVTAWALLRPDVTGLEAAGVLLIEADRRPVQHPDGGYVAQVLVRDGDRVAAGDRLMMLDAARLAAQIDPLQARARTLRALVTRLEAEQVGRADLRSDAEDPGLAAALAEQREVLRGRRAALDAQVALLQQRARQLREESAGMTAQDQARSRQIQLLYLQRDALGDPQRAGATSRARLLVLERDIARLDGERGDLAATVARLGQAAGEAEMQALQLRRALAEESGSAVEAARAALAQTQGQLAALQDRLRRLEIRAPVAGVVSGLVAGAPGAAIAPGQEIMRITAATERLFVEADLPPEALERFSAGAPALVDYAGQRATGRLLRVAPERRTDAASGLTFQRARFALDEGSLAGRPLLPGAPVRVTPGP